MFYSNRLVFQCRAGVSLAECVSLGWGFEVPDLSVPGVIRQWVERSLSRNETASGQELGGQP